MKYAVLTFLFSALASLGFSQQKVYNILDFGAVADGITNNAASIQKAIDTASEKGGGQVSVPQGNFCLGTIYMKSGVNLHLKAGARLLGSTKRADYNDPSALTLIAARNQKDIAITGNGIIDGQGAELVKDIFKMLQAGLLKDPEWKKKRPVEGNRPTLIGFTECKNVKIRLVSLKNAAAWVQNYHSCTNLVIDSINVESTTYWNNDGVDIVNCKDVKITNCDINTADDGICLKSEGQPAGICENVYVADCSIRSSASAFKLGTGSHGGFKNITVRNLTVYDTYRSAIALECVDGGILEDINIQGVTAKNTGNAIFIRLGHRNTSGAPGILRNVYIANVKVETPSGKPDLGYPLEGPLVKFPCNVVPSSITGIPGHPVQNITLENIEITYNGGAKKEIAHFGLDSLSKVPEKKSNYPEFSMFGELPAWGFYARHAEGLTMKNVRLSYNEDDFRPACIFDDVTGLTLNRIQIPTAKEMPVIIFSDVQKLSTADIKLPVEEGKGIRFQKNINRL